MATENKNLSEYDKATIPNAKSLRFGISCFQNGILLLLKDYLRGHMTL